jgi:nitrogen-specific signal transduction histidine kinase
MGWGKDILYVSVMNRDGQFLGYSGDIDESWKGKALQDSSSRKDETEISNRKLDLNGRSLLEVIGPMYIDNRLVGTVRVGLDRQRADQLLNEYRTSMIISMAAIMVIGVLAIWLLFYNQNRHLKKIGEMSKRLQRSERLSSLGQLAAGVAHEIRNPLNAISMASQRMQREYMPLLEKDRRESFKQLTGVVRDEIRRLNAIIEEFLTFSKTDRLEMREYAIEEVLQKIANLVEEEAHAKDIQIKREWNHGQSVIAMDMDKLQQAFLNFVKNGIESISGEGGLTRSQTGRTGAHLQPRVYDQRAGARIGSFNRS